ncbi:hypothetical protein Mapa_004984 [Marchantia paleacea]|nr:hypothetical protein Mapa_004984 [Marchantia paleacea]
MAMICSSSVTVVTAYMRLVAGIGWLLLQWQRCSSFPAFVCCSSIVSWNQIELCHQGPGPGRWWVLCCHWDASLFIRFWKDGPIMTVCLGVYLLVVVSNAEMAKELFGKHDQNFSHRHYMTAGKYLGFGFRSVAFATYMEGWQNLRKLYNAALLSPSSVQRSMGLRESEVHTLMGRIYNCYESDQPVNISRTFRELSTTILLAMIFGRNEFGLEKIPWLAAIMKDFGELAGRVIVADFFPSLRGLDLQGFFRKMREVQEQMRKCTTALLLELDQNNRSEADVVREDESCLANTLLKFNSTGEIDLDDMTMAIFDNIIGGTEPPAIAMDWTMAELLRHPKIMRKANEEIAAVVGENRLVKETDIPHLPYIQNIVKESLRLHPSAPLSISHVNKQPCKIAGYEIPARTSTLINLWAIGRDPNRWQNPLEFNPDRFFEPMNSNVCAMGHHLELIPFSAGRRGCPGMHLASATMTLTVATLLHSFDWKPFGIEAHEINMKEPQQTEFICQRQSEVF